MSELSTPEAATSGAAASVSTPAGLQDAATLRRRRWLLTALNILTLAGLTRILTLVLGGDGWTPTDTGILLCFLLATPWTVMGFWNAVIGFWLLHGMRRPLAKVSPFLPAGEAGEPLRLRTAVLLTLRNEDPERAFARLRAVQHSLDDTGEGEQFVYFVLSDSSTLEIAAAEEALFSAWEREFPGPGRAHYRRRERNSGFKAGNIRDFVERWGEGYDLMLPLDADSVMSGDEIVRLVRLMQAHPRLGIVQSLVVGTPAASAFARIFQFGMRHGMRAYTMGSAWWHGDCGPYWGHNALIRVAPFAAHCRLPVLPGPPPLGGPVLSHDQIEAALMRRAGYEVRVVPVEGGSWEDTPPTLADFTKRDLRWCQGNMQYWRLIGLPGLTPVSRFQIAAAIMMYLGAAAWVAMTLLAAAKTVALVEGSAFTPGQRDWGIALFATLFAMSQAPKIAGMLDVAATRGGVARYGGLSRFWAGAVVETLFSMLLAPVVAVRITLFLVSLAFGRTVTWSGQQRDAHGLTWATAWAGLWPQTLFGLGMAGWLTWTAPAVLPWVAPMLAGLILAIPFAVLTAAPRFGRLLAACGLCAVPEEFALPRELRAIDRSDRSRDGPDAQAGRSGALSAMPAG